MLSEFTARAIIQKVYLFPSQLQWACLMPSERSLEWSAPEMEIWLPGETVKWRKIQPMLLSSSTTFIPISWRCTEMQSGFPDQMSLSIHNSW